eukprot:3934792-Rhodomonas_salina.5
MSCFSTNRMSATWTPDTRQSQMRHRREEMGSATGSPHSALPPSSAPFAAGRTASAGPASLARTRRHPAAPFGCTTSCHR